MVPGSPLVEPLLAHTYSKAAARPELVRMWQQARPMLMRRWQRAEAAKEAAEEGQRPGARAGASTAQAAVPPDAALSVEEKLASRRQIFAPREAFGCGPARLLDPSALSAPATPCSCTMHWIASSCCLSSARWQQSKVKCMAWRA